MKKAMFLIMLSMATALPLAAISTGGDTFTLAMITYSTPITRVVVTGEDIENADFVDLKLELFTWQSFTVRMLDTRVSNIAVRVYFEDDYAESRFVCWIHPREVVSAIFCRPGGLRLDIAGW